MASSQQFEYRCIVPPASLRGLVEHFWTFRGSAPGGNLLQHVPPMRYGEIVVQYGDGYQRWTPSGFAEEERVGLFGPMVATQPLRPVGAIDVLAVRFTPTGLHHLFNVSVNELAARALSVDSVVAARLRGRWRALGEASPSDRLRLLISALESHLPTVRMSANTRMDWVLEQLHRGRSVRLTRIAEQAGTSMRQLEYDFSSRVGLSAREYRSTLRIERAITLLLRSGNMSLSRLAQELGYHDHAHFSRDFAQRVGRSPGGFRRDHRGAFFFDG